MRSHVAPMSPTPIERLWNLAFHSAHTLRACETRGFMVGCLSSTRTPRCTNAAWWCKTACFKPYHHARSPGSPQRGTCFMTHAGSTTISLCRNLGACSLRLRLQKTVLAPCIEARRLQPLGGTPARLLQVLLLDLFFHDLLFSLFLFWSSTPFDPWGGAKQARVRGGRTTNCGGAK